MSFHDDLLWKIWEIEEDVRRRQQEQASLENKLRQALRDTGREQAGLLNLPCGEDIKREYDAHSYSIDFSSKSFYINLLGNRDKKLFHAGFTLTSDAQPECGSASCVHINIDNLRSFSELQASVSAGRAELMINKRHVDWADLQHPSSARILQDYQKILQDCMVAFIENMKSSEARSASDARGGGNGGGDSSKNALETINRISCVCATAGWIGLAICGPTCLGTTIALAVDP